MFKQNKRLVIIAFCSLLIYLVALSSASVYGVHSPSNTRGFSFLGTSSFNEDFSTTTYRDAGNTDVSGCGTGSITNPLIYTITPLDFYSTSYPVHSIDVQGRKVYAVVYSSLGTASIQVFNISDPTDIAQMGTRSASNYLISGEVEGDVYYVGTTNLAGTWLGVYNVSNPNSIPSPLDTTSLSGGDICDFDVQGHFLYVVTNGAVADDFTIIDIEDPSNINIIYEGSWTDLYGVTVEGQLAYLADGIYGLYIQNVSNPYSVTGVDSIDTTGNSTDVLLDGNFAYVADGTSGVQVVNVTDPSDIAIIGNYDTPGNASRLALQGNTLFVADHEGGVRILRVSNPLSPSTLTSISSIYAYDVGLYGDVLVVGTNDGIRTYRVSAIASNLPLASTYDSYDAYDVDVQGNIAYVAGGTDGLVVLDVTDHVSPVLLDTIQHATPCNYTSVKVQGNHVFVSNFIFGSATRGLLSFDVSDPTNVKYLDQVTFSEGYEIFIDGDVAYIADGTLGLYLLNISNPYNMGPNIGSPYYDIENYTSVWVQGHFVYAAGTGSGAGFVVYDATDLSNLYLTDRRTLSYLNDITVSGDFCVVSDGIAGTYLYDVTDPWNIPGPMDYYGPAGTNVTYATALFENYIIAAERHGGVYLLDASNPYDLQLITHYTAPDMDALRVTIHGDYAYVANRNSLKIFRIILSTADTFRDPCSAQSLTIDTTTLQIENATLTYTGNMPTGTSIVWFMSADGGSNWDSVTPSVLHTFSNNGSDLRWRAIITSTCQDRTAIISSISISYAYKEETTITTPPIPGFPIEAIAIGAIFALGIGLLRRQHRMNNE
jgi:hypothetical protein